VPLSELRQNKLIIGARISPRGAGPLGVGGGDSACFLTLVRLVVRVPAKKICQIKEAGYLVSDSVGFNTTQGKEFVNRYPRSERESG